MELGVLGEAWGTGQNGNPPKAFDSSSFLSHSLGAPGGARRGALVTSPSPSSSHSQMQSEGFDAMTKTKNS